MKKMKSFRLEEETIDKIKMLARSLRQSESGIIQEAVDNYIKTMKEKFTMKTYANLQELSGYESGLIDYGDGELAILNWSHVQGIPRELASQWIGLGDEIIAQSCPTPKNHIQAMSEHSEHEQDHNQDNYQSWKIQDGIIVTINKNWN